MLSKLTSTLEAVITGRYGLLQVPRLYRLRRLRETDEERSISLAVVTREICFFFLIAGIDLIYFLVSL